MNKPSILVVLIAVIAGTGGSVAAGGFNTLLPSKAELSVVSGIPVATPAADPAPVKVASRIKTAVLKTAGYMEQEFNGKILTNSELTDLTAQMNYLAALPDKDIPTELLGYLEGISISIQDLLPKGPVGRDIKPALKAARALQLKVSAIG
ncbi:MAG TPA: hypothetical protein DCL44_08265 [Elusimicrobia bacterium]|nr:hypothetical protein [Elusimicrobiota bacterium]